MLEVDYASLLPIAASVVPSRYPARNRRRAADRGFRHVSACPPALQYIHSQLLWLNPWFHPHFLAFALSLYSLPAIPSQFLLGALHMFGHSGMTTLGNRSTSNSVIRDSWGTLWCIFVDLSFLRSNMESSCHAFAIFVGGAPPHVCAQRHGDRLGRQTTVWTNSYWGTMGSGLALLIPNNDTCRLGQLA